jgi:hypothetical protein
VSKRAREQAARRAAREILNERQRQQAERERRLEQAAIRVLVALRERDEAAAECERRAGVALCEMTQDEGLSIREAVDWFAGYLTVGEATRLRRSALTQGEHGAQSRVSGAVQPHPLNGAQPDHARRQGTSTLSVNQAKSAR